MCLGCGVDCFAGDVAGVGVKIRLPEKGNFARDGEANGRATGGCSRNWAEWLDGARGRLGKEGVCTEGLVGCGWGMASVDRVHDSTSHDITPHEMTQHDET